jgi:hypothetical protein
LENPILSISKNKLAGQKKLEEDSKKPRMGKKDKKPKRYIPACDAIVSALAKSTVVKQVDMLGVVADPWEWETKLAVLGERVRVVWRAPDAEPFRFRVRQRPQPPAKKPEPTKAPAPRRK